MPITGLTSASEPKHTQRGKRGAQMPITGLTLTSEPKQHNRWTGSLGLSLQLSNTNKQTANAKEYGDSSLAKVKQHTQKEKGRPERSAQSPAYILHLV